MTQLNMHYVCTRDEARQILARQDRFWLSDCGCRLKRVCARSRTDVCLDFEPQAPSSGHGLREASRDDIEEVLREAERKHLVVRPFRDESRTRTAGFCFCCDDCCGYFLEPEENPCDKGAYIQRTDEAACTHCGDCADVCYFHARRMQGDRLAVDSEACYGCGLCLDVCPADCITMVRR